MKGQSKQNNNKTINFRIRKEQKGSLNGLYFLEPDKWTNKVNASIFRMNKKKATKLASKFGCKVEEIEK